MNTGKVVLCGANAYEKKYYFNKEFEKIPESIKEELHIICVLFTEEIGGIFTICFDEDGTLELETDAAPEDYLYDEIGSGLLVRKIRDTKQELLQSLSLYYRVLFLHEDVTDLLADSEQVGFRIGALKVVMGHSCVMCFFTRLWNEYPYTRPSEHVGT